MDGDCPLFNPQDILTATPCAAEVRTHSEEYAALNGLVPVKLPNGDFAYITFDDYTTLNSTEFILSSDGSKVMVEAQYPSINSTSPEQGCTNSSVAMRGTATPVPTMVEP